MYLYIYINSYIYIYIYIYILWFYKFRMLGVEDHRPGVSAVTFTKARSVAASTTPWASASAV